MQINMGGTAVFYSSFLPSNIPNKRFGSINFQPKPIRDLGYFYLIKFTITIKSSNAIYVYGVYLKNKLIGTLW